MRRALALSLCAALVWTSASPAWAAERFIRVAAAPQAAAPRLEAPDAATLAWLADRVPGLDVSRVRVVPFELAEAAVKEAIARRATYLDVLTIPQLRDPNGDSYFIPEDVLARVHRRYVTGALPMEGTTLDGRPFRMRAILVGAGRADFFYEEPAGFSFRDNADELRIAPGGHLTGQLLGPGDLGLQGLSGCGCVLVLCGCADIQRLTLSSEPGKVDVQTSMGPRQNPLGPIHPR